MKNLTQYILEGRSISDLGISYDVFHRFIDEWILFNENPHEIDQSVEASDAYNALVDVLKPKTRDYKSAIKALYKYVDDFFAKLAECGVTNITDNIIQLMYYRISQMPATKLENLLGVGEEGIVVELRDKVIKCFFGDKLPKYKLEFYKACKSGKYNIFPKVQRIGKGYVVMEKLKMYTEKCDTYQYIIDKVYYQVYDGKYNLEEYSEQEQEVILWLEQVKKAVIEVTHFNNMGDLDEKNFGEREDGTIVYFDI